MIHNLVILCGWLREWLLIRQCYVITHLLLFCEMLRTGNELHVVNQLQHDTLFVDIV